jgi:XRE family transcriptional regulator, regulator of sulfur utilization
MAKRASSSKSGGVERGKLGKRICKLRNARGWSQETLAQRSGIHAHHLGKIERGEANATLATLLAIARPLRVTISHLFEGISWLERVSKIGFESSMKTGAEAQKMGERPFSQVLKNPLPELKFGASTGGRSNIFLKHALVQQWLWRTS